MYIDKFCVILNIPICMHVAKTIMKRIWPLNYPSVVIFDKFKDNITETVFLILILFCYTTKIFMYMLTIFDSSQNLECHVMKPMNLIKSLELHISL